VTSGKDSLRAQNKSQIYSGETWKPFLNKTKEIIFYDITPSLPTLSWPVLVTMFTIKNSNTQKSLVALQFSRAAKNLG
jgi:hypothetical protein